MNKHRDSLILIAIAIILVSVLIFPSPKIANADHVAPEVQTQVNKQTDLFQKSVSNLPDFTSRLEEGKQAGIDSMGDGGEAGPSGLSSISKKSKSELESVSDELSAINEHELDSRGREEMIRKNAINELYMDYSRPLNKQHLKDAKLIAEGQNQLLDNLFAILKEKAGIDCKTIRGDKKIEPEYFLQIKNTTHKDTVYNQTFCEELRNIYNCTEKVKLECAEKVNEPFAIKSGANYQTEQGKEGLEGQNEWSGIAGKDGPISYLDGNNDYIISSSTYTPTPHDNKHALLSRCWHGAGTDVNVYSTFVLDSYPAGSRFHIVQARMRGLRQIFFNDQLVLDLGGNCVVSAAGSNIEASYRDLIDVSHLAKAGENKIRIRYLSLSHGGGTLKLRATKQVCARWNEKWDEETCVLK